MKMTCWERLHIAREGQCVAAVLVIFWKGPATKVGIPQFQFRVWKTCDVREIRRSHARVHPYAHTCRPFLSVAVEGAQRCHPDLEVHRKDQNREVRFQTRDQMTR